MKIYLLFLLTFIFISSNEDIDSLLFKNFQKFIKKYNKKYFSLNEYLARYQVFKQNLIKTYSNNQYSHRTGITKFSDLTSQEFAKTYLNLEFSAEALINTNPVHIKNSNSAPDSFDWRDKNILPQVKDQQTCGACWAFSLIANLESLYAIEKGEIENFSEQFLIDCDNDESGCNGGLMEFVYSWLKKNGGFMYEKDYPYTNSKGSCQDDSTKYVDMKVTGYNKLGTSYGLYSPVDEDEMKEFLYENCPLAIALNSTPLKEYIDGIIDLSKYQCSEDGINHAVVVVGYGVDSDTGLKYWIVRNSWGKDWGEDGYFRIARGKGACGVNQYVITATVEF